MIEGFSTDTECHVKAFAKLCEEYKLDFDRQMQAALINRMNQLNSIYFGEMTDAKQLFKSQMEAKDRYQRGPNA